MLETTDPVFFTMQRTLATKVAIGGEAAALWTPAMAALLAAAIGERQVSGYCTDLQLWH